jgi:hypothetical protein
MSDTREDNRISLAAWIVLLAVCSGGALYAVTHFASAFPIISLDIRMDREAALASAGELAARYGWGPDDYRQAASFSLEPTVQEFLELEGGGVEAFRDALGRDDFHPYRWRVRLFREMERNETLVSFAPDGTPYGFREQLPEDAPGASLAQDEARAIAERSATGDWNLDLAGYRQIESSQETRPGGRIDHSYVYERNGVAYNEGRLRLRLVVGGDRLTELTHFLEIPEAFTRRYAEMRSTNELIGAVGQIAAFLGYLFGACAVALFFLYRERWVLWRRALMWGAFIAALQALVVLNQLPLAWMGYDTALSSGNFLIQQIGFALLNFVVYAVVFTVSFMAAESMTRRAFPNQVQLWRVWSPGVANSARIAGQTILGYLLLGLFFGYEVFLYYFAQSRLGWWTPSGALTDPDVLAAHFPWFDAIAISLQAGFWEESLFRAVPIAGAALLGRRFGRPKAWIAGAFVMQALIFGAGHAAYPTQPAYARVVELIIPSIGFGLVYLLFGLLPAIVLHFAFDVVWFAMPLFASSAPGVWVDRGLVIALTLVPLWVVLVRRVRAGGWATVPPEARNGAWRPPPAQEVAYAEPEVAIGTMAPAVRRLLPVAGLVGLALWIGFTGFALEEPGIAIDRETAVSTARAELARRGVELSPAWRTLSLVATGVVDQQHRFVWQEGGRQAFEQLRGNYLRVPRWVVRFARFEGDVAERAEEYLVVVNGDGAVSRFVHRLPEARPGADLSEEDARQIAARAVREAFGIAFTAPDEPGGLVEVSAETASRPARRDWTFTLRDPDAWEMEDGSARIEVDLAGDEITEINRFVYVPEDWARADRDQRVVPDALAIASNVIGVLIVLAGAGAAGVAWARGRFSVRAFLTVAAIVFALGAADFINAWPAIIANLNTAQPIAAQVVVLIAGTSIGVIGLAAVMGLLAGWLLRQQRDSAAHQPSLTGSLAAGVSLGLWVAGVRAALAALGPSLEPPWGAYGVADAFLPALGTALAPMTNLVSSTLFLLLVFSVVGRWTAGWTRRTTAAAGLLAALGLLATANPPIAMASWLLSVVVLGIVAVAAYVLVLRYDLAVLPAAVAAPMVLVHARWAIIAPYPGARAGSFAAMLLLGAAAALAVALLRGKGPRRVAEV